jgi:uncharacterized phiE125 gp8 family phage protein
MKIITQPTYEPLSVAEVAEYIRVDDLAAETVTIEAMITAARQYLEQYLSRYIATQTIEIAFDTFQDEMTIAAPLQSVTSITYLDGTGATQTLNANQYLVDTYQEPAVITPAFGVVYPETYDVPNAVKIRCVVGYTTGDSPDTNPMPKPLKFAMLLLIGDLYANREGQVAGTIISENKTLTHLLSFYRLQMGV